MIIVLLIASTLGLLFSFVFAEKLGQKILAAVFFVFFIASLILSVSNTDFHFGMEQVERTKTTELVSSGDASLDLDLLLYQTLDEEGQENVYLYKTSSKQKKPKTTTADVSVTNQVQTGAEEAQKVTTTTRWEYKNDWYKFLFGIYNNNHEYVKQKNVFVIPDSWVVLSTDEAQQLGELAQKAQKEQSSAEAQEKAQAALKEYLQEEMTQALKENPEMSDEQQEKLTEELTAEYTKNLQTEALKQLIAEVQK
ncbi:MAG: DUF4811 domain-containing protein [Enterococcus sp.]